MIQVRRKVRRKMNNKKKSKIKMNATRLICLIIVALMLVGGTIATALAIALSV